MKDEDSIAGLQAGISQQSSRTTGTTFQIGEGCDTLPLDDGNRLRSGAGDGLQLEREVHDARSVPFPDQDLLVGGRGQHDHSVFRESQAIQSLPPRVRDVSLQLPNQRSLVDVPELDGWVVPT